MLSIRAICIIALTIYVSSLVVAPVQARATTYYIDYNSGVNSNPGTKTMPWKTHPYMSQGSACTNTGVVPAYSHVAGDRFIFKGGVTWPQACFQLDVTSSGTSGAHDYYGVDPTWYAGGAWTRPIFDLAQGSPASGTVTIRVSGSYADFEGFELRGQVIYLPASWTGCDGGIFNAEAGSNITATNMYIHGWKGTKRDLLNVGSNNSGFCGYGLKVFNSEVDGSDALPADLPFLSCWRNIGEVSGGKCHHTAQATVGYESIHGVQIYNINGLPIQDYTNYAFHTNIFENVSPDDTQIYDNLIHDISTGVIFLVCGGVTSAGGLRIYNNVIYNTAGSGGSSPVEVDTNCGGDSSLYAYIYNNTIDCTSYGACVSTGNRGASFGTMVIRNNHFIGSGVCYNMSGCDPIVHPTITNNVTQSMANANSQGYTSRNNFAPTSSSGATVGVGMNLLNVAFPALNYDILGVSRPSNGGWDAGAYQFGTGTAPGGPSGLKAIVQ